MNSIIVIHETDTVGNAIVDIKKNEKIRNGNEKLVALDAIPFAFKVALVDMKKGDSIIKYGEVIGIASIPIKAGQLVHTHNVEGNRGRGDLNEA